MIAGVFCLLVATAIATTYLFRSISVRFSLSFLLFASLLAIHGVGLLVFLLWTSKESTIYGLAMSAVDEGQTLLTLLLSVSLMFLFVTAGSHTAVLVGRLRGSRPLPEVAQVFRLGAVGNTVLLLLVLAMFAVSVLDGQLGSIREYFAVDLSGIDRGALRLQSGGTPYYLYNLFLAAVAPFVFFVAYSSWRSRGRPIGAGLVVVSLFAAILLGKFGTLSRAPPVLFLLQIVLLRALLVRKGLDVRRFLGVTTALLVLFGAIVAATFPELDLAGVFGFLYYRMFDIPNEGLVEYFSAIPTYLPHGWGAGIFPHLFAGTERLPNYVAVAALNRGSYNSTSNSLFIADAWAEFAWGGVILFSFFAGLIVRLIDLYAQRIGRNDEWACVTTACTFGVFTLLSTSMTTAMLTGGLAIVPVLSWMFASGASRRKGTGTSIVWQQGTGDNAGLPAPHEKPQTLNT